MSVLANRHSRWEGAGKGDYGMAKKGRKWAAPFGAAQPVVLAQWFVTPVDAGCVDTAARKYVPPWPIAENVPELVEYCLVGPMAGTVRLRSVSA